MSDLTAAKDLGRRIVKHAGLLLGGGLMAGATFFLGLLGIDLAVPTMMAIVIGVVTIVVAAIKAHAEVLAERDQARTERDQARAEAAAARPTVSKKCIDDLARQLNRANTLFVQPIQTKEELDGYKKAVEAWVIETEALIDGCAGRSDADLFHNIAGRPRMRFLGSFNQTHDDIRHNLNGWKSNLADLVRRYKGM